MATSRAFRALKISDLVAANLNLKLRQRGCSDGQYVESLVLLQTAGGECPEDLSLLAGDECLDLMLADEFRDGNVPTQQPPLTCAQLAFAALPDDIRPRYFRGDTACHEHELLHGLKHPDRTQAPGGRIGLPSVPG